MRKFGFIEPVVLSPVEKGEHKEIMRGAQKLIKPTRESLGLSTSRFRADYLAGKILLVGKTRDAMEALQELEPIILAGYVREAMVLVRAFHIANQAKHYLSESDWQQEATLAMVDAIYGYDGSSAEFSTYVYKTVKFRLIKFAHNQQALKGIGKKTFNLSLRFNYMLQDGLTNDEALTALRKEGVTEMSLRSIMRATAKVVSGALAWSAGIANAPQCEEDDEERQKQLSDMRRVVEEANLNVAERAVINAYLASDPTKRGWQVKMAHERGVSKQRIGQIYHEARRRLISYIA